MSQDLIRQKHLYKKPLFYPQSSLSFSQEKGNLGEVFYCMDLQEQVKVTWQRHVQQKQMEPSSLLAHQILSVSGLENLKDWSNNCLKWQEKTNLQLFSSMRLILYVEAEVKERTRLQEELKLNSQYRCKVSEMTMMESQFQVQPTYLGNQILPSEEDSRREFTFPFLISKQDLACLRSDQERHLTLFPMMTFLNLVRQLKAILVQI